VQTPTPARRLITAAADRITKRPITPSRPKRCAKDRYSASLFDFSRKRARRFRAQLLLRPPPSAPSVSYYFIRPFWGVHSRAISRFSFPAPRSSSSYFPENACLPLASALLARRRSVREPPQKVTPSRPPPPAAPFIRLVPTSRPFIVTSRSVNIRHGRFGLVLPATRPVADRPLRSTRGLDREPSPAPSAPLRLASRRLSQFSRGHVQHFNRVRLSSEIKAVDRGRVSAPAIALARRIALASMISRAR